MSLESIRPLLAEAAQALQRGALEAAQAACAAALARAPDSPDALNLAGLVAFRRGDLDAARAALSRAVTRHPGYGNAWRNLAAVCAAAGREDEAIDADWRALETERAPTFADWYNLGVRAQRAGRLARAAACYERALARRPDAPAALNNLAILRDAQRRPVEARALAARLLEVAPDEPAARHTFAAIHSRATEPADLARALTVAESLLAADPEHAGANECAAVVLGKIGRHAEAVTHARRAVAADPAHRGFRLTLARLLDEAGQHDAAAEVLAAALREAPADPGLLRQLGTVELKRARPDAAEAALAAAWQAAPQDQGVIAQRALAWYRLGEHTRARGWLGAARFVHAVRLAVPAPYATLDAFHRALAADIRGHSRLRYEPVGLAARGGYLTEDLLADRTPAILGFERSLRAAIDTYIGALQEDPGHPFLRRLPRRYALNLWATRVAAQGTIDTHIHEESWLSGAYYVELPPGIGAGSDRAGWLEFGRPHRGLPDVPDEAIHAVRPEPGLLLLFPSYLYHRTLPFAGDGERISISFDLAETID